MPRLAAVAILALSLLFVATPLARSEATGKLPALVTFKGVAGAVPDMSAEELWQQWEVRLPIIKSADSSSNVEFAPVCAGQQQGVAIFLYDQLKELRFYRGARTDAGVGIGSTLAQLRRAYGRRLKLVSRTNGHVYEVRARTAPPRNRIEFALGRQGRLVTELSFGRTGIGAWGEVYGIQC